jgi:hypothetical protein
MVSSPEARVGVFEYGSVGSLRILTLVITIVSLQCEGGKFCAEAIVDRFRTLGCRVSFSSWNAKLGGVYSRRNVRGSGICD